MSVTEALQLMMGFGMFVIAMISLVININKKDK
ncbi:putative holin-like toxin [Marinilactibacillus sp. Marseille-P9653]|nr:putative holin-like toxin [Marinilactibacillus sp. Marseille-P9653]